jgi:ATP-dependent DNA helicase RecG
LGSAQSGARSHLRLLRVIRDEELIAKARLIAENLLSQDPKLAAHPQLANAVEKLRQEERAAYLEKR